MINPTGEAPCQREKGQAWSQLGLVLVRTRETGYNAYGQSKFAIIPHFPGKRKCLTNPCTQITAASQSPELRNGIVSCRARVATCSSRGGGARSSLALAGRRSASRFRTTSPGKSRV